MNKKYKRWFYVLLWALIIFMFSNQTGSDSSNNNRFILQILKSLNINIDYIFKSKTDYIIRKTAHFTEYFILCYLIFNALYIDLSRKKSLFLSLLFTFLYACSDEFHQMFIAGRGPSFKDVMIDTFGGAFYSIINHIREIKRRRFIDI
ncbi:VanZ like family protein [Caloramator quimbayensis]|uniref:VanZ like family protein n=1 Tax=Caloramator quimbayensis TaxID=1147123 RepID=A0A1T4YG20_9CLOT|nr:VanZ family protein [Caloramator quimbayensis]SKB00724.1 VanZ like family protein [Caloramator quimbayensis]